MYILSNLLVSVSISGMETRILSFACINDSNDKRCICTVFEKFHDNLRKLGIYFNYYIQQNETNDHSGSLLCMQVVMQYKCKMTASNFRIKWIRTFFVLSVATFAQILERTTWLLPFSPIETSLLKWSYNTCWHLLHQSLSGCCNYQESYLSW